MHLKIVSDKLYSQTGEKLPNNGIVAFFSYQTYTNGQLQMPTKEDQNNFVMLYVEYYASQVKRQQGWKKTAVFVNTAPNTYEELEEGRRLTLTQAQFNGFNRADVAAKIQEYILSIDPTATVTVEDN